MVLPKTSLSVGRGRVRDGMPVSTLCLGDATRTSERLQGWFAVAATRQEHGPQPGPNPAHRPIREPASASPADQCRHDRDNPAPITIEAGIRSPPGSRRGTHRSYKKIRNRNPMPDTKPPDPSDQHLEQLPPVKRTFGYFCCNRQKSLASASEAVGEKAFEFEFEVEFDLKAAAPSRVYLGLPLTLAIRHLTTCS